MTCTLEEAIRVLHRHWLDEEYRDIVAHLEGGILHGEPVDTSDPRQLVVAAYHMGLSNWWGELAHRPKEA